MILFHFFIINQQQQLSQMDRLSKKTPLIFTHWYEYLQGKCTSLSIYYLKIWCIWALNLPVRISVCLSLKSMAFCQLGLAPSAEVSTLKSEGQRGDVSIDTLLEITLSLPEIPSCRSSTIARRWLWILGLGLRNAIKKANVINFLWERPLLGDSRQGWTKGMWHRNYSSSWRLMWHSEEISERWGNWQKHSHLID